MSEPVLTNSDIVELAAWRRDLHRHPELSGEEAWTAKQAEHLLKATGPDRIVTGLGGHGVAAVYDSGRPGPSITLRCELDALPIFETGDAPHRSTIEGKAHLCGHDGHMAVLAGVARWLGRNRPARGSVVLMFQPAEEDGAGAAAVIADPASADLATDYALALHNFPGLPLGHAVLAEGPMNCASRGMRVVLSGRTAHASQPETGVSPAPAVARLIHGLTALARGGGVADPGFRLVTVTHARLGDPAFGVAPGHAELWATLRTVRDDDMGELVALAEEMVRAEATRDGLQADVGYRDVFDACDNHPEAVAVLQAALEEESVPMAQMALPMRASEDFGRFRQRSRTAMFLLGAGEDLPALHNPDYDFPDELIETGARVMIRAIRMQCGAEPR